MQLLKKAVEAYKDKLETTTRDEQYDSAYGISEDNCATLYLNTSEKDFQGGHIIFPEIEYDVVDISPQEGMLVGFRSDRNFIHQTTPVTQGNRFSVSLWMTFDNDRAENWD
jgi:predicted 2-oxoglutarate/Fe(II)-dependent dioxygenase YbiX